MSVLLTLPLVVVLVLVTSPIPVVTFLPVANLFSILTFRSPFRLLL
jgi:hypothetical protein